MSASTTFKGVPFKKSSVCNFDPICVEVAIAGNQVAVRDSKNPEKEPHVFTSEEWKGFIMGVKNGEFDV